jgi:hypothetical protein
MSSTLSLAFPPMIVQLYSSVVVVVVTVTSLPSFVLWLDVPKFGDTDSYLQSMTGSIVFGINNCKVDTLLRMSVWEVLYQADNLNMPMCMS